MVAAVGGMRGAGVDARVERLDVEAVCREEGGDAGDQAGLVDSKQLDTRARRAAERGAPANLALGRRDVDPRRLHAQPALPARRDERLAQRVRPAGRRRHDHHEGDVVADGDDLGGGDVCARRRDALAQPRDKPEPVGAVRSHKDVRVADCEAGLWRRLLLRADEALHRRQPDAIRVGEAPHRDRAPDPEHNGRRPRHHRDEARVERGAGERGGRVQRTRLALARVEDALVAPPDEDVADQPTAGGGEHAAEAADGEGHGRRNGRLRADDSEGAQAQRVAQEERVRAQQPHGLERLGAKEGCEADADREEEEGCLPEPEDGQPAEQHVADGPAAERGDGADKDAAERVHAGLAGDEAP
mmetsp:Transcript_11456/g.37872  ORF Transcript_11456/g.37872 Transcript_11456/m.37872 type:complete len:358 (-) Transcript_11456:371-1444(-)